MHDGCAAGLGARFTGDPACTGGDHHAGRSQLAPSR